MDGTPLQTPAAPSTRRFGWRQHGVAAWFAFHFLCVFIYILPYPPYFDDRTLQMPEVKEELGRFFGGIHRFAPVFRSADELKDFTIKWVREYTSVYFKVRRWFAEPYLDAVGSAQTWNMFGGTPPRFPKTFIVEVQPRGEAEFVPWRDFSWGRPEFKEADFRDFKCHEILGLNGWDRQREWYAEFQARAWNREHPDRPAERVRFAYWQLTTPPIERVRAGDRDRRPRRVQEFTWTIRPQPQVQP